MMMLGSVWPQISVNHEGRCWDDATDRGLPQNSVTWNGLDNRRLPDTFPQTLATRAIEQFAVT